MAAFEAVSRVKIQRIAGDLEIIDMRFALLPDQRPPLDGFDPRDYREPKTVISPWMAYFNMLRSAFGPGILAMPMAVSQAGILLGPMMTLLISFIVAHMHLVLLWCLNEIARQLKISHISYRYGFRLAMFHGPPILHILGHCAPTIIAISMFLSQIGTCTLFVLLTSDNLRDIMDWDTNAPALVSLFIPYMVLELSMKNLRYVSYVSMGANVLTIAGLTVVLYELTKAPGSEVNLAVARSIPIFFSFGINLFNLSAVGVMLSCEKALLNPKIMTGYFGILNLGIIIPTIVSIVVGTTGYKAFGGMEENVLRYLPYDQSTSLAALGLYLVSAGLSYPLQCYPGIQVLLEVVKNHDPYVVPSDKSMKALEFVVRPIFVCLTFAIAYLIPFQGPFVAFVGTLCTTMLVLIGPALLEIGVLYPDNYGKYNYIIVKDSIIVIFGLVIWSVGLYLCASLIYIRHLSSNTIDNFYMI